jgi:hypothetical protein
MYSMNIKILVIGIVIGWILGAHLLCSCSNISLKDGVKEGMSLLSGRSSPSTLVTNSLNENNIYNPPPIVSVPASLMPPSDGDILIGNKSKPEWCPAIYATSTGCIKLTDDQATYLNERGGNRTMAPSEY